MKKKIIPTLIILVILALGTYHVNAEEITPQVSSAAWPQAFTYKEFEYTIEGIELRIFKVNQKNTETTTTTDKDGATVKVTKTLDADKYFNDEPIKVIELSPTEYSITPEYKEDKLNNNKATFIKLNLNLTKEKATEILNEEMQQVTKDIIYFADVVVKYKITKAKETYKYFQNINTLRLIAKTFIPETKIPDFTTELNKVNKQVINTITMKEDEEGNKTITYNTILSETAENIGFSLNYLAMASQENENAQPEEIIMFHNFENIEYLIENLQNIQDDTEEQIKDLTPPVTDNSQIVKVDNTAKKVPMYIYIISALSITLGAIFIVLVLNKRKQKNY